MGRLVVSLLAVCVRCADSTRVIHTRQVTPTIVPIGLVGKFARGSCCSRPGKRFWVYNMQPRTLMYYKQPRDYERKKKTKGTIALNPATQFWYSANMGKSTFQWGLKLDQ